MNRLIFTRGLSIGNTSRPRHSTMYRLLFARSEPALALFIREHLEHRLLVHDFASERIHQAHVMVHICADERMRVIKARQEFVDDHSLVNEIDAKRAASKLPLLILEIVRRTNDGRNTVCAEMFFQKNE